MSYNTGTKGHSMKLEDDKFRTGWRKDFCEMCPQAEESLSCRQRSCPLQETAKASNAAGFEKS